MRQVKTLRLEVTLPSLETLVEASSTASQRASVHPRFQLSLRNVDQVFSFLMHSLCALCAVIDVTKPREPARGLVSLDSALLLSYLERFWAAIRSRLESLSYTGMIGSCLSMFLKVLPPNVSCTTGVGGTSSFLFKSVMLMSQVFETLLSESVPLVLKSALERPLCYSLIETALVCTKSQRVRDVCFAHLLPILMDLRKNENLNNDVIVSGLD